MPKIEAKAGGTSGGCRFVIKTLDCNVIDTVIDAELFQLKRIESAIVGPGRKLTELKHPVGSAGIMGLVLSGVGANVDLPWQVGQITVDLTAPLAAGGTAYSVDQLSTYGRFVLLHPEQLQLQMGQSATLLRTASGVLEPSSGTTVTANGLTYTIASTGQTLVITATGTAPNATPGPDTAVPATGDSGGALLPLLGLAVLLLIATRWLGPRRGGTVQ